MKMIVCAGCESPILDRFLSKVEERAWHAECVKCWDCQGVLADKCFARDGKLFCRTDFFRRFGPKCGGCGEGLRPTDLVRRARGRTFHVACFTCLLCRKQPSTGEELYVLDGARFLCKDDFRRQHQPPLASPLDSPECEQELAVSPTLDGDSSAGGYRDVVSGGSGASSPHPAPPGGPPSDPAGAGEEGSAGGTKRRGPRTTIKAKQLETLKAAFAATPKPTRHIREQLAQETGLNMRVIQVWFQNRRSKERRMKQLSSLGARRHFFRSPRRAMRPLRGALADDLQPHAANNFAYFSDSNSPNDFNYGPHPAFYDYFHGPHGPTSDFPGTIPIGPQGSSPLEHQPLLPNGSATEAPYAGAVPECPASRPSPDGADGSFVGVSRPLDSFAPFLPTSLGETRVW